MPRSRGGGAYRCYLIATEQAGGDLPLGDFAAGVILHRGDFAEGEVCIGIVLQ